MHILKPQKIQSKFITGLVAAVLLLGTLFSIGSYYHLRSVLEAEVRDKARLIFMHVDGIQHYVRDTLRPVMYQRIPESFIIQAMSSSYISRKIMAGVNAPGEGTLYRRVAIDARNPDYEANLLEQELIGLFRQSNREQFWQGYKVIDGEEYYVMARPVRFTGECMYCHGRAEDAPAELLEKYGNRGFDKETDMIAGVDFVGTSVPKSVGRVQQTIFTYFAFFALGALLFFFTTNVLFRLLVVNNLKRLNTVFRRNVEDDKGSTLVSQLEQGDEIDELVDGIEQMSEHLFEARRQLRNYAENLRKMVDERTAALSAETIARQSDVQLFVRLLEEMNKSRSRGQLWLLALPRIAERFGAERISYVCTMGPQRSFVWPEDSSPPQQPADYVGIVTGGTCVATDTAVYIPVESSSGNAEGLLCLSWQTAAEAARQDMRVLQALGRQLGMAAENLTAIDGLARQMNILETIFEGISDPLVLMDTNCAVLTANQAARRLTTELSDGTRSDGNVLSFFFDIKSPRCPLRETINRGMADLRELCQPNGRSFALSLYPVPSDSGATAQVVVYLRETTREKQLQQQIWHAEKMATVGQLTAGLAHEINNPLGVILCYTGLLRQSLVTPDQTTDLDIIERHTRQAQRVLQDLLNFSRPKATDSETADACAVAASVREVFAAQAAKKQVHTQLDCPLRPLPVQLGVGAMEQVISNLIINALDAAPQGEGQILVRVGESAGNMVTVEIADNGPGVAAADAPYIFDPFFSTKEIGTGTGLGLTVIYGIIHDIGGRVEIDRSAELGGARFIVYLPAAKDDHQPDRLRQ
jgi:two-component system, NtrC family, sensor kinase